MLITLGLLLGAWRYTVASPPGDAHAISASIGIGTLELRGNVSDEPKLEGKIRVLLVAVNAVSIKRRCVLAKCAWTSRSGGPW